MSRWLPPVLLVIASLLVGVVHVPQHESLSPIDEYVYVDYFDKVLDQGVVRHGEEVGDFARRELGCRGLRILLPVPDDRCTTAESILSDDSRFPMGGLTSADIYTPLYFAVTRVLAQPLLWTGLVDSPTQAGRLIGTLWLAAAALVFFFALRRLRLGEWAAAGITLLIVGSLPAYWFTTYLSADAPTLLAGAGILLLGLRFVQGGRVGVVARRGSAGRDLAEVPELRGDRSGCDRVARPRRVRAVRVATRRTAEEAAPRPAGDGRRLHGR